MIVRMLTALVKRANDGDLFALEQLQRIVRVAPNHLALGIWSAHFGPAGYSYGEIARELGITRQAARQAAEGTKAA